MENRFYKVEQSGGIFVTAHFYNPITDEENWQCVRDYEYDDGSHDNDELYYMEIDEEVRKMWLHKHGVITAGDTVKVVKGRTIPRGTVATVKDKKPYRDRYGRTVAIYLYFEDGRKINEDNCVLMGV